MRRREFIAGLGIAVMAADADSTAAQKIGEMPRIVVVGIEPDQKVIEAFGKGTRAAGWTDDANARVEYRWGSNDPQVITAVATEVVSSNPSLIVTIGSPNTLAARKLTSAIPIVFAVVSYPTGQGIVTNLAHPGGNVTGFSHFDTGMGGKWATANSRNDTADDAVCINLQTRRGSLR